MKLVENWTTIATRAWSMYLMAAAAVLEIVREVVPDWTETIPQWVTAAVIVGAALARVVKQSNIPDGPAE
ncbi:DUF7940 domain-containing protein [Salinarimonas sp. NSM]|uniref:DUF7940 domain-containing protein n=1 Tax=Salinarimonas sp. NSM TaxID=3458003 RepID=UPI0040356956